MAKLFENKDIVRSPAYASPMADAGGNDGDSAIVIPVIREDLVVGKRVVETGQGVRVVKTVSERAQIVDDLLGRTDVNVERVTVNKLVPAGHTPGVRYEGETMVVPTFEEVLHIEKRTFLKEELRITSKRWEVRDPKTFVLRTENVSVEHFNDRSGHDSSLP